eukprot:CAMPEP_0117464164 /NCGR_PEP_ID=MMETSP0784-20121206/3960_1 /TAXON_ID=39447 /ORGANISM="" /LENGTH=103 /DNA_ID=CAMNT_0005258015 /DNA_START=515 /DNA_END=826 /DNA_ORIENTATION=+
MAPATAPWLKPRTPSNPSGSLSSNAKRMASDLFHPKRVRCPSGSIFQSHHPNRCAATPGSSGKKLVQQCGASTKTKSATKHFKARRNDPVPQNLGTLPITVQA